MDAAAEAATARSNKSETPDQGRGFLFKLDGF
jgi:hypothetical protein